MEYKEELNQYNKYSTWTLKQCHQNFKCHMTNKNKKLFDYLVERLRKEKRLYKFSSEFNIIIKRSNYFYFELCDDFSFEYINFQNKQVFSRFKSKKEIDLFMGGLR